jgi:hypothetical protein
MCIGIRNWKGSQGLKGSVEPQRERERERYCMVSTKMKDLPEASVASIAMRMLMVFVKLDFILLYPLLCF